MPRIVHAATRLLVLVLVGMLVSTSAVVAEKPSGPMGKKHDQQGMSYGHGDNHDDKDRDKDKDKDRDHAYFGDRHREIVLNYYSERFRTGKCPPGLAKKDNGCRPPGLAKKWQVGHRLPRDVIFYDLPTALSVQLGPAPARHRFVRVASDILLIAVGTGMVIDAIEDLGNL